MNSCFRLPNFTLDTAAMGKVCKYHKRKGQEYKPNDIIRDFCSDAFYAAYPYCLALLYGADKNEFKNGRVCLSCPNPKGIIFEARRVHCRPFYTRIVKKILEWLIAKILYPPDWENWHIKLRVIKNHGGCPANFTAGKTYWFNIRRLDELCPASFHAIYPFFLPYLLEYNSLWQKERSSIEIHCPDHQGMIYNIKK
jgi:uncharacterized repeat protein (TIGR04076 family)